MIAPSPPEPSPRRLRDYSPHVVAGGLSVIAAAIAMFTVLLKSVAETEGLARIDLPVVQALAADRAPELVSLMRIVTTLGSPVAMTILAVVVCGGLAWRRRRIEPLALAVVGVAGIGAIDTAAKDIVARPRPPSLLHTVTANGYSFPSGHAIFSALVILLCTAMTTHWVIPQPRQRAVLWTGSVTVIAVVGFSRVYLGVHYPSDILAGWTLAIAWATTLGLATMGIHAGRARKCRSSAGTDR